MSSNDDADLWKDDGSSSFNKMLTLKDKSCKRSAILRGPVASPAFSSSTLTPGQSNVVAKRYRKMSPCNPWSGGGSSLSFIDPVWNCVDTSNDDTQDVIEPQSASSCSGLKHASAEYFGIASHSRAFETGVCSGDEEQCSAGDHVSVVPNSMQSPLKRPRSPPTSIADTLYQSISSAVPRIAQKIAHTNVPCHGEVYEDEEADVRWDFYDSVVCPLVYTEDIYRTMRILEKKFRLVPNFLAEQQEISEEIRAKVIDWMAHYQQRYALKMETLHLAVSILDRLLCKIEFGRSKREEFAAVALMIASKLEDERPLIVSFVVNNVISYRVECSSMAKIEQSALHHLGFRPQAPTAYNFAGYLNIMVRSDQPQIDLVNRLLERALRVSEFSEHAPSEVALACLLAARFVLHRDFSRAWINKCLPHCDICYDRPSALMLSFIGIHLKDEDRNAKQPEQ